MSALARAVLDAAWSFVENVDDEDPDRTTRLSALRPIVRQAQVAPPLPADQVEDTLSHLVSRSIDCLNYGKPAPLARSQPSDDDFCELFNRLDRARKLLARVTPDAHARLKIAQYRHQATP